MSFVGPRNFINGAIVFRHSEPLRRFVNGDTDHPIITPEALLADIFSNLNVALDDSKIYGKCLIR
jgi:hypothetical protein